MATYLKVRYRGKDIKVKITTSICEKDGVKFLCHIDNMDKFEIKIDENAMWVIVGKQVVSKRLVALIGDSYINSLFH